MGRDEGGNGRRLGGDRSGERDETRRLVTTTPPKVPIKDPIGIPDIKFSCRYK